MRIERSCFGSIGVDAADYGCGFTYEMDPPEPIVVCGVVSGGLEAGPDRREATFCRPGEVYAFGAADGLGYRGRVRRGKYYHVVVDRSLLNRAAGTPSHNSEPVRLTDSTPLSPAANRHLFDCIDYLHGVAAAGYADRNQLIRSNLEQYLAAVLLAIFPSTAPQQPTRAEMRGITPVLLKRAMRFIDDNAHTDLSLADIAAAVHITPRALQYMFRKHRDCTPTEYLRRVRMHHAHRDLLIADRAEATVADIARRWGFAHPGRFAVHYREQYGQSPQVTLRTDRARLTG